MDQHAARDSWDLYVFGLPLIALLVFGFFRLDQVFTARKSKPRESRHQSRDQRTSEQSMRSDPDGRSWDSPRSQKE